jgi:hypothetical protein
LTAFAFRGIIAREKGKSAPSWSEQLSGVPSHPHPKESGMQNLDDIKKQFVEQVKLRAYDDKYIDKGEEREILQIALQQGVTVDSARQALAQVCENNGYVLESKALAQIKDLIDTFAQNDGHIDQKEFADTLTTLKKATQGKKNDIQLKRMIIEIIEDNGYKCKQGMFNHWFDAIKKEVGK